MKDDCGAMLPYGDNVFPYWDSVISVIQPVIMHIRFAFAVQLPAGGVQIEYELGRPVVVKTLRPPHHG